MTSQVDSISYWFKDEEPLVQIDSKTLFLGAITLGPLTGLVIGLICVLLEIK